VKFVDDDDDDVVKIFTKIQSVVYTRSW